MLLSLFLVAETSLSNFNGNEDEECIGLILLTATLCLMLPIIYTANSIKKYYPLYSH